MSSAASQPWWVPHAYSRQDGMISGGIRLAVFTLPLLARRVVVGVSTTLAGAAGGGQQNVVEKLEGPAHQ